MSNQPVYITREGYAKLEAELNHLRTVRRQEVARRLHYALAEGDVLENAELEAARNEQAFVEGRILDLEAVLRRAEMIEEGGTPGDVVQMGNKVTIVEGDGPPETYHIVGPAEASPAEGKISYESPLGKALVGCRLGEDATVQAPDGVLVFRVVEIH